MTELETFRRRRTLVALSCDVQRTTLVHRFARIEAHPGALAIRFATRLAGAFVAPRVAVVAYTLARRALLRPRAAS
jgi:hypothetical protein